MRIVGLDSISGELGTNAHVMMDWTQEKLDRDMSGLRKPLFTWKYFNSNVAILAWEALIVMVPVAIMRRMRMVALRQNARVRRRKGKEAIATQERNGRDVPAPMVGQQWRLETLDLIFMGMPLTNTPAARAGQ